MGLITMVIFLTMLTLLTGWVYLGITQRSPLDILIPGGLGAGTGLMLLAEIEDSPQEFLLAIIILTMGIMMTIPIFNSIQPFIGC